MSLNSINIRLEGSKFYPSKLREKTNLPLKILAEYGELSNKGRYKGKASPYGLAILQTSPNNKKKDLFELIEGYCNTLLKYKNKLEASGVEEIIFDVETDNRLPVNPIPEPNISKNLYLLKAKVEFHSVGDKEDITI